MTEPIAVVGLAGRFPGADDVATFWENLCAGRESITRFDAPGAPPRFVGAEGVLSDIEGFDAHFFGYSPREAEIMDPQHRLALETAWAAFDSAGYDPASIADPVGVFLSASLSSYLVRNLLPDPDFVRHAGGFGLLIHNDKDFAATTISHKLGLTGPSYAVGSACSSSLVAVHLACRSLLSFECDMALAGGVSLQVPQRQGYVYAEDGVYSPDGRCAAFDAEAGGTVGGSGVGVVLLKRLSDARRDGDLVHALVLGSAVNNDGARKVGYTAPGVDGQAAVIAEAHAAAGVDAGTIGYVEAHGTGTNLGDPVEVAALTEAFRAGSPGRCALGSVKTNVGHLDAAAGITGLIKSVCVVRDGVIPASLHYRVPNPRIDFAATPFHVAGTTRDWTDVPRRAGVSSFGIGGTNAHVVLEQPPPRQPRDRDLRPVQALVLSARSEQALADASRGLAEHLRREPGVDLADLAATLGGRRAFEYRRAVVCPDTVSAVELLERPESRTGSGRVVFLFPGQGAAAAGMAKELAAADATFRGHLDECAATLADLGVDLAEAMDRPHAIELAQPALFAVEHALARTFADWGIEPAAMIGHSLGEYVAATLAGVFSLPDALRLVTVRARLQSELAQGRMLAVSLPAAQVPLPDGVSVAAVNAPDRCVVAGAPEPVDALAETLRERGVDCTPLTMPHAFHTAAVDPILARFRDTLAGVEFHPPTVPIASNVTGDWASADQVCTPRYWVEHMRRPVRFADGVARCLREPGVLVEVGPRAGLAGLVRRQSDAHQVMSALPRPGESEVDSVVTAAARLWTTGCPVRWDAFHLQQRPRRVSVPAYPFQRERYWVDPPAPQASGDLVAPLRAALSQSDPTGTRSVDDHPGLRAGLEQLCAALATRYARDVDDTQVLPAFTRFHQFLLSLAESGAAPEQPGVLAAQLKQTHAGFAGLIDLLVHCADAYPRALTTPGAALATLYPDGSADLLRRTLGDQTVEHRAITRLCTLVGDLLGRLAGRGTVRVLEIGAGEGNLTRHLVTRAGGKLRYHATDVSRLFADRIAEEAASRGLDFVTTGVFDIAADPAAQGLSGGYDLVCGLDVVHATPDVLVSLRNLKSLLAPGGVLALVETVADDPWLSMIWGLSEDWWHHRDGLRSAGPLLSAARWQDVMAGCGFAGTEVLTPATGPRDAALVLATGPATTEWPDKRSDIETWGYRPAWQHAPLPETTALTGSCLLFGSGPLTHAVHRRLAALGADVVQVTHDDPARYRDLLTGRPRHVVHLLAAEDALARGHAATPATVAQSQQHGLHSLLRLARGLGQAGEPVRLVAVTAGAQDVLGDDLAHPEHATVLAAVKVVPREYPSISCTAVDVDPARVAADADWLAARVVDEVAAPPDAESTVVAYRGRRRFAPGHVPFPLRSAPTWLRPGGVYLVCGGLGGIGLNLAEALGRLPAKVVLTRRRPFPEPDRWADHLAAHPDDPVSKLITRLQGITAAGGEVLVLPADLTDAHALRNVVAEAERRFGSINGVVHAAGVPDTAGIIARRSAEDTDAAIAAKVHGTAVLDDVLGDRELDFFVLCSSIGTVLHKLKYGEVGYVAGNEYLNAYAAYRAARTPGTTAAIAWTDWLESGMWADAQERLADRYAVSPAEDLLGGLTAQEGVEVFRRVLGHGIAPQVVVSTKDLGVLLERHAAYRTTDHLAAVSGLSAAGGRSRAGLRTTYRAPGNDVERTLATWYADLLGYDRIGRDDDFFELGGDSLVALRLLSMVRSAYGVDVPVDRLFDGPTVAGLADLVAAGADRREVVL